jgi:hypothetical protein
VEVDDDHPLSATVASGRLVELVRDWPAELLRVRAGCARSGRASISTIASSASGSLLPAGMVSETRVRSPSASADGTMHLRGTA